MPPRSIGNFEGEAGGWFPAGACTEICSPTGMDSNQAEWISLRQDS